MFVQHGSKILRKYVELNIVNVFGKSKINQTKISMWN